MHADLFVSDLTPLPRPVVTEYRAALKRSLLTMKVVVARAKGAGRTTLDRSTLWLYRWRYAVLPAEGDTGELPPTHAGRTKGKRERTPAGRILFRLRRDRTWVLRFLEDFAVTCDNNEDGRDLRMTKVEQDVSGIVRTLLGTTTFCTLRSCSVTGRNRV